MFLSLGFFIYAGFIASNNDKKQKMEKEAVEETYQEEKKDYERMMLSPMKAVLIYPIKSTIITPLFRTCRKQKKIYKAYIL